MKYQQKFVSLEDAIKDAIIQSVKNKDVTFYVVLSTGEYYVDTSSFVRTWERLECIYMNGKAVKT